MLLQSSALSRAVRLHRGFASGARDFIGDKLSGASDKSQDTVQDAAKQAQESVQDKAEKVAHHVAANLPPQFVKFMNSGYLHAMKQLRDQVLKEEWLEHGQQAAKRAAIAQFEGKLAEEGRVSDAADPAPTAPSAQPPVPAAGQQGQHAARTASRPEQEAEPASKPSSIDRQVQAEVAADQDSSPGPACQAAEGGGEQSSAHGGGGGGGKADASVGGKGGGGSPPSGDARTRDSSSSSSSSSIEGSRGKAAASAAGDGTRGGEESEVQGSSGGGAGGGAQTAQEQSALPYSVITRLYQQPDKMDVIQDPVLRARLRSLMHTLLDEREREAYRDATNRAEDMATFFKSGPSSMLDALQSLLPLPGFLKSKS